MDSKLTSEEKQYIKKYLNNVESLDAATWPEWAYTSILAFGGLLQLFPF